jgi:hypothetical protein
VPCSFSGLFIHIYRHAGLKFHGELGINDGDLLNQPPDKRLIVFGPGGGLLPQERNKNERMNHLFYQTYTVTIRGIKHGKLAYKLKNQDTSRGF